MDWHTKLCQVRAIRPPQVVEGILRDTKGSVKLSLCFAPARERRFCPASCWKQQIGLAGNILKNLFREAADQYAMFAFILAEAQRKRD